MLYVSYITLYLIIIINNYYTSYIIFQFNYN